MPVLGRTRCFCVDRCEQAHRGSASGAASDGSPRFARGSHRPRARGSDSSAPRRCSIAVVVEMIITGPSTRYSWVTSFPVSGSLPVEAMREFAFALQEFQGIACARAPLLPRRAQGFCA